MWRSRPGPPDRGALNVRAFLLRRAIQMGVTLWVILTILFLMFRLLPADPAALLIDQKLPPEGEPPASWLRSTR